MTIPWLYRLLAYTPFKGVPKPEAAICLQINSALTVLAMEKLLRGIYLHVPNENTASKTTRALLRAMGMIPGAPDFIIGGGGLGILCIEVKHKTPQTPKQKLFQQWCELWGVPYHICHSWAEVQTALVQHGFLS